jgi:glycosyltransferase involved in cell wall biosynthesis
MGRATAGCGRVKRLLYISADPGIPVLGHKGASVHLRALVQAFARSVATVVASPRVEPEGERLDAATQLVAIDEVLPLAYGDDESLYAAADRQAAQVIELARSIEADAIYERYSLFSAAGVRAAAELGLAHVLEVNAPLRAEALIYRRLPHPEVAAELEREVFAGTHRMLAVSETLAHLLERDGVDRRKLEIVGNAIEPSLFKAPRNVQPDVFTVGFAGSLKPWHGIEVLIEAVRMASAEVPRFRLEIVGDGPARSLFDEADFRPGVLVRYGHLTHAATTRAMTRWDVGAAPYAPLEDFYFSPLKLVEYMAAGVCPVASDLPELRDLLGRGEYGVLVEPGSAAALAETLVDLASKRQRAAVIGRRARRHALGSLSWSANARRALDALRTERRALAV